MSHVFPVGQLSLDKDIFTFLTFCFCCFFLFILHKWRIFNSHSAKNRLQFLPWHVLSQNELISLMREMFDMCLIDYRPTSHLQCLNKGKNEFLAQRLLWGSCSQVFCLLSFETQFPHSLSVCRHSSLSPLYLKCVSLCSELWGVFLLFLSGSSDSSLPGDYQTAWSERGSSAGGWRRAQRGGAMRSWADLDPLRGEQEEHKDMFSELSGFNLTSNLSEPSTAPGQEGDEEWRDAPLERLSRGGHVVVSVCLGSIMVFGFLNNLLVLVLFCRFKSLRTPVNMMLLNISVSDMLVCACGTTLSFASSLQRRWLYGRRGCMWYGFVNSCFGKCMYPWSLRAREALSGYRSELTNHWLHLRAT